MTPTFTLDHLDRLDLGNGFVVAVAYAPGHDPLLVVADLTAGNGDFPLPPRRPTEADR